MLKRSNRVPKNLFPLLKKNTLYEGGVFSLRVTKEHKLLSLQNTLVICIVSKKISKKAVDRNKVKRRVYSILTKYLQTTDKKMVVQIFPKEKEKVLKLSYQDQKKELLELFNSIV